MIRALLLLIAVLVVCDTVVYIQGPDHRDFLWSHEPGIVRWAQNHWRYVPRECEIQLQSKPEDQEEE